MGGVCCYESPIGCLLLHSSNDGLLSIEFVDPIGENMQPTIADPICREAITQLEEYFKGKRFAFTIPLTPQGTPFQRRVWDLLLQVPYGETVSYQVIAKQLGGANLTRAVGLANGANPIPIFIPCHRVVGSNGKLTGYRGGIDRKKWLLQHEMRYYVQLTGHTRLF
jgi:methylated-DNA-[protein]-cysteine S-methyltransferase